MMIEILCWPDDEVGVRLGHDVFLRADVFLLSCVDNVTFLQDLHSKRFRLLTLKLHLKKNRHQNYFYLYIHFSLISGDTQTIKNTSMSQCCTGRHISSSPWTHPVVYFDSEPQSPSCCHKYSQEQKMSFHMLLKIVPKKHYFLLVD